MFKILSMRRKRSHRWRLCPGGKHWVKTHLRSVEPTEKNPDGITSVRGHCRTNPSHKDQIYAEEIWQIAKKYFDDLKSLPVSDNLGVKGGNKFDRIIAGWTKYWNETLKPETALDPNLVKALIFTESNFNLKATAKAGKRNNARGLMQITDQTIDILKDERGELKDYLVNIDQNKSLDPNLNICAGTRWLFHKKYLLENKLGRKASWVEAAMEYKSYTGSLNKGDSSAKKQQSKLLRAYERLKNEIKRF